MEGFFVLLGLVVLAIPFAVIYLLVANARLTRRVADLERQWADPEGVPRQTDAVPEAIAADAETTSPVAAPPPADPAKEAVKAPPASGPWQGGRASRPLSSDVPPASTPLPPAPSAPKSLSAIVRDKRRNRFGDWLKENWFYAVSALSLALAGVFLVQYGMEQGLLPPPVRVLAALAFGAALIAGGEVIRRRYGDDETSTTAYLPSTFSGAGIVTLFAAILSARVLYDLIGPEMALVGMMAVGAVAIILGWFYGPLLAGVGIIGAMAAPFVVGGSSENPSWLFGYFAVVTLVGLAVDAIRRWAWVTVVSLVMAYGAGWMVQASGAPVTTVPYVIYLVGLMLAAIAIPPLRPIPTHAGAMCSQAIIRASASSKLPEFPTYIAGGAVVASTGFIALIDQSTAADFWLIVCVLTVITLALLIWARGAEALADLAAVPAVTLLLMSVAQSEGGVVSRAFRTIPENAEAGMPLSVTWLVGIAMLITATFGWRALTASRYKVIWGGAATLYAPVMAILLELTWQPAEVIGAYPWALHAAAIAAVMVLLAERFARVDGADRLRVSFATLSALSALSFAFVIIFSDVALTLAFVVTVVAAVALDRRFNLPLMTWFVTIGIGAIGYRLIVDPGLDWARTAPLAEVVVAYLGAFAGFLGGLWLLRDRDRMQMRILLDSAAWSTGGVLISLLLYRFVRDAAGVDAVTTHWSAGLHAVIWLVLALTQARRLQLGGPFYTLRLILAGIFGTIAAAAMVLGIVSYNPLWAVGDGRVLGPVLINSLIPGYLLPALVLGLGAWRLTSLPKNIRLGLAAIALVPAMVWLFLAIRHFWQGADGMALPGLGQGELYSYTIVLLVIGGGLFYQSLARGSALMRRAGILVLGLAIAKVFLVDISGLGGLIRVFSLLALGLLLAGLAWLNRWAQAKHAPRADDDEGDGPEG